MSDRAAVSAVIACVTIVCAVYALVYFERARPGPCVDEVHAPDGYFTKCSDPRARLVVPSGWTWFKCECPEVRP
jgi:hypothetical protein